MDLPAIEPHPLLLNSNCGADVFLVIGAPAEWCRCLGNDDVVGPFSVWAMTSSMELTAFAHLVLAPMRGSGRCAGE